jgi:succinate dehydrogenase / fumarate reductase cytochrome b subunit
MNFTNTIIGKKLMAIAGLGWFVYVIFHLSTLLIYHQGKQEFNEFYRQLNQFSWYYLMIAILIILLVFHIYTAISRQISNNKSKGVGYHKPYPKAIPRIIAWVGSSVLFIFIVIHFIQMKILTNDYWYQAIDELLSQPLMWIFYLFGLITLNAHLHHGLTNVLQTLGITHKTYNYLVILIISILFFGFLSILMSVIL